MTHELKTWPEFFEDILSGKKNFEARKDDRVFRVGDILVLEEYELGEYSGRKIEVEVTYKLHGGSFGIEKGYCVLAIKPIELKDM